MSRQHGAYALHNQKVRARSARQMSTMADLVSEGWTITAAARELGLSQQGGSFLWGKIKADLGWQAA